MAHPNIAFAKKSQSTGDPDQYQADHPETQQTKG
jgi:hypothetical protein